MWLGLELVFLVSTGIYCLLFFIWHAQNAAKLSCSWGLLPVLLRIVYHLLITCSDDHRLHFPQNWGSMPPVIIRMQLSSRWVSLLWSTTLASQGLKSMIKMALHLPRQLVGIFFVGLLIVVLDFWFFLVRIMREKRWLTNWLLEFKKGLTLGCWAF